MVGEYKKIYALKACAKNREDQVFKQRTIWANELHLNPVLIKQLFATIIKEVRKNHQKIKNGE
ncbi:chorismate mutase [Patescibacteria group bacterium]|nr:chorismate mutase [Patescibacteria group bacterium]MBU1246863.1 chorismate mutase [Patescibacteria group bacterium]MBU1519505.1 chorismate mutase [Patescibacteria group bacterium]MBU1730216.1 chorismate mutase [Patescibacteria group bacterium]MBU1956147.1 chorismate mutase [Patescibacteria group bacterium]